MTKPGFTLLMLLIATSFVAEAFLSQESTVVSKSVVHHPIQRLSSPNRENTPKSSKTSPVGSDDDEVKDEAGKMIKSSNKNGDQETLLFGSTFPLLDQLLDNFNSTAILETAKAVKQNVMQGETGKRGEVYFVIQAALAICILTGGVPVLGFAVHLAFGPALLLGGLVTIAFSVLKMGSALSPWPVPNDNTNTLLSTGALYSQVRHPMYAGVLASAVGFSVTTDSSIRLLLTAVLWYVLDLKSDYEEEALVQRFGAKYQDYQKEVTNKFIPQALLDKLPWHKKRDNFLPPGDKTINFQ